MKIKTLILENFRSYRSRTEIHFDDLTALIGRNDAGKSSLIEALDIFFDGGTVKIDQRDASFGGDARQVRIGVVFSSLPDYFILDSNARTRLSDKYLLNANGDQGLSLWLKWVSRRPSRISASRPCG